MIPAFLIKIDFKLTLVWLKDNTVIMKFLKLIHKEHFFQWGVTPLIDNFVDDTYYYLITVYTGMRRGAGTRSRVGFIVAGEDDDTGVRELYDGVRTVQIR